ncbi:MAG: UDP-N-acetylmuramate dehydrogenase [Lunatimonas sp.]|uniref:UDP-N-acetylmuramate dehydrogenase n=1 Tax=Lunatimonas sp. TaxID=2060141 RepID=UPI00263A4725|nr:UDP-N-acetylmuramate dehydrogenase [Lunatimonas sp.]MCC5937011.1 UDP-N-acetylmuramate dehydrogenase [Lunatimonas sp.]
MQIRENFSLRHLNTFGLDQRARFFTEVHSLEQLKEALNWSKEKGLPVWILGGGSNVLLTKDLEGLVLKVGIKGREVIEENELEVLVTVGAGENWHEFVRFAISQGWGGVENLSLIPGTVGAAPIQNIGAYGVEIKDVFHRLEAIDKDSAESLIFDHEACAFGYRDSFFKREGRNRYVICYVTFKLSKTPVYNLSYGTVEETMHELGHVEPSLIAVSEAISFIRRQKLPDPAKLGNAGSFFKNPVITSQHYQSLKEKYPTLPGFPFDGGMKIPAAWLIDQGGWKGKRWGTVGVHERQPLVLVNYGSGKGRDIVHLSQTISNSIKEKFGVLLEAEVNHW